MTGVVIIPPCNVTLLLSGTEPLYQHRIRQGTVNKHIWELILNIKGITQTRNTGTLLVAIVSIERLNSWVLIFCRTDLQRIYHHL